MSRQLSGKGILHAVGVLAVVPVLGGMAFLVWALGGAMTFWDRYRGGRLRGELRTKSISPMARPDDQDRITLANSVPADD